MQPPKITKCRIVAEGRFGPPVTAANPQGVPIEVGTEFENSEAWMLCMPEAGTEIVIAEPADEATEKFVAFKMEKRAARMRSRARQGDDDAARQLREVHNEEPPEVDQAAAQQQQAAQKKRRRPTPKK